MLFDLRNLMADRNIDATSPNSSVVIILYKVSWYQNSLQQSWSDLYFWSQDVNYETHSHASNLLVFEGISFHSSLWTRDVAEKNIAFSCKVAPTS